VVAIVKVVPAIVVVVPITPARASAVIAAGEQRDKNNDRPGRVELSILPANRFHDQILETNARDTRRGQCAAGSFIPLRTNSIFSSKVRWQVRRACLHPTA
jgi:hypothetical protein